VKLVSDILNHLPPGAEPIIQDSQGRLVVPNRPAVGYIEGEGTGPDIWRAARLILDAAVNTTYAGARQIAWIELSAGEKAWKATGSVLPEETVAGIAALKVAIKGPLTTPVGKGFRSVNVTLRQRLDLYACVRPVRWLMGVPSPVNHPEMVDMVIFRENTEDVYTGIEWPAGSPEAAAVVGFLNGRLDTKIPAGAAIGIKPMSEAGCKRLIRRALDFALVQGRKSVTLVHKGNIMKYTEGAFRDWGYELAEREYAGRVVREDEQLGPGQVIIKDRIADNMFQQALLRPQEYDVLATPNLNGDYLSDALAAQVGGLGMAPGANIGDAAAVFEATHGSAPKYAGLDKVNPSSMVLSGAMLLEHLGWSEAAALIPRALKRTIMGGRVTYDLARQIEGATEVPCSVFAAHVVATL
jgi:isocitrate dehydrogenase